MPRKVDEGSDSKKIKDVVLNVDALIEELQRLNGMGFSISITIGVSIMTAMAKGMKIGGLFPETVDDETLDRMIAEQKPMVVLSVDEQLPATLAFTY